MTAVTVLITVYNARGFIRASVESALAQDYAGPLRVVVVDDGSTDGGLEALNDIADDRLTVIAAPRVGRARALNIGLLAVEAGNIVANLDADDCMLPSRVRLQVDYLDRHPDVAVVGGAYYEAHTDNTSEGVSWFLVKPPCEPDEFASQTPFRFPICHSCSTYRRDLILEAGGFSPTLRARLDYDVWVRVSYCGYRIANISQVVGVIRKSEGTNFGRRFSRVRSALQMLRLNWMAVKAFRLERWRYVFCCVRFVYSLLRARSVRNRPLDGARCLVPNELPNSYLTSLSAGIQ